MLKPTSLLWRGGYSFRNLSFPQFKIIKPQFSCNAIPDTFGNFAWNHGNSSSGRGKQWRKGRPSGYYGGASGCCGKRIP